MMEKILESPLDSKGIKPVNPKGNQLWIFIGRTDAEAEATILCPHDGNSWLTGKDFDAGKDWRWKEKGIASPTQWTWVWANTGRYWRTEEPGMLHSMGLQRVTHYLATEQRQCSMQDLSSPTRDWTHAPCSGNVQSKPLQETLSAETINGIKKFWIKRKIPPAPSFLLYFVRKGCLWGQNHEKERETAQGCYVNHLWNQLPLGFFWTEMY